MPRPIVIAGMHRSGTSLTAGMLREMGVHLGERLLLGGIGNPRGHFEDLDFLEFHDRLLAARGAAPLFVPSGFQIVPTPDEESEARALVAARAERPLWGFKDPRATLLLDFWRRLLPDAVFVLLYRHPVEVLLSLLRRGLDLDVLARPATALACWEEYNRRVLEFRHASGSRCLLWNASAVTRAPAEALEVLVARVGAAWAPSSKTIRPFELHGGLAAREIDWSAVIPRAMETYGALEELADLRSPSAPSSRPVRDLEAAAEHLLAATLAGPPADDPVPPHLRFCYSELKRSEQDLREEIERLGALSTQLSAQLARREEAWERLGTTRSWRAMRTWWDVSAAVRRTPLALRNRRALQTARRRHPAPDDLLVGCVTENDAAFLSRTLRLVRSIRWLGGSMASAPLLVCAIEGIDAGAQRSLEALDAEVRVVPRFDPRSPFANKLQFFPEAERTGARELLLLDCDTLVVRDPLPLLPGGVFSAKVADVPSVTHDVFVRVFAHFGLRLPARRHVTTLLGVPTIPYFNSGMISMPASLARDLVPAWRDYNARLLDDSGLLGACAKHANQASLSLALAARGVPFLEAPAAANFPLHMAHLPRDPGLLEVDPAIVHYHDLVDDDGFLLPSRYPRAAARIDEFHRLLLREREAEGRTRASGGSHPRT